MTWVKGQSGNPHGRVTQREAEKDLRAAVKEVIQKGRQKGKTKLEVICAQIAQAAMDGEPWACGMVFDRLDGRAIQVIDQKLTHDAGEVFVELLRRLNEMRMGNGKLIEHAEPAE